MPAVVALPAFWYAIAGTSAAAATVYAAKKNAGANTRASDITERTTQEALDWEKEVDARQRKEYEDERRRAWELEDVDRQFRNDDRLFNREEYQKREGRLTPYREFGDQGLANMASLLRPNPTAPSLRVQPTVQMGAPRPPVMPVPPVQAAAMPSRFAPNGPTMADLLAMAPRPPAQLRA